MRRLTDIAVRNAEARLMQYTLWDGATGFGLRVSPGGTKTWTVVYGRDRRRVTIGRYPLLDLKSARKAAHKLLAEVTLGHSHSPTTTLKELIELFFQVRCTPQNNKPSTIVEYRRIFNRHLTPALNLKLADITHAKINRIIDGLAKTPIEANHAFVAFRMLFRFARQRRLIERDPLDGLSLPYLPKSRDRVLTDQELRLIWKTAQSFPFPFGNLVSLLILTGQRVGEVSGLKWSWINDSDMTITLPAQITKNSTQHTFPYSGMAKCIFEATPHLSEFVFPSLDGTAAYVGYNKAKGRFEMACNAALAKAMNDHTDKLKHWTLHDLRRTFSTVHARIGTPPHVTEALLNHKTGTRSPIQRIYDRHTYLPEMKAAIGNYESNLAKLIQNE